MRALPSYILVFASDAKLDIVSLNPITLLGRYEGIVAPARLASTVPVQIVTDLCS